MSTAAVIPTATQAAATSSKSTTPTAAIPGTATAKSQTSANPFATASAAVPASTAASTNSAADTTSTAQSTGINWNGGAKTVTGDFEATYGKGTGDAITQVLQNMGTATDSAVKSTTAATDAAATKEYADIRSNEAGAGVTANSSTAALASGDFYSGVNTGLQSTISNMELNEENTLLSTLVGEGTEHGSDSSTMHAVGAGLNAAGKGVSMIPGIGTVIGAGMQGVGSGMEAASE
jgi:hypothetical protein